MCVSDRSGAWGKAVTSDFDPERTSQSQSRPVVPDRGPDLSRRVAALKRCISSSIFSAFSSSCMSFDFLGASLRRSSLSTLPSDSLFISAIVTYYGTHEVDDCSYNRLSLSCLTGSYSLRITMDIKC